MFRARDFINVGVVLNMKSTLYPKPYSIYLRGTCVCVCIHYCPAGFPHCSLTQLNVSLSSLKREPQGGVLSRLAREPTWRVRGLSK